MGRFTLRDEGKTIAVGKVLKYKPYDKKVGAAGPAGAGTGVTAGKATGPAKTVTQGPEMVYDMETGEMRPKKPDLDKIVEGDEEDN